MIEKINSLQKKQKVRIANFLVISSFFLKLFYGMTRNIFDSGPDANTFKQMAQDIAALGYLNSTISGFPIYSPGYPVFLAFNKIIFGNYWITSSQIFQITLTCVTGLIVYNISQIFLNPAGSLFVLSITLFHPAFIVISVSCMYESLLIFCLALIIKISFCSKNNEYFLTLATISTISVLIHPRIIPVVIVAIFMYTKKEKTKYRNIKIMSLIAINLIGCLLVALRNYKYSNYFGLAQGAENGIRYGHPRQVDCDSVTECFWESLIEQPTKFVVEMVQNILHFFSPWSGPLEYGTWFHNISFYTLINNAIGEKPAVLVSLISSSMSVLLILYGLNLGKKINFKLTKFVAFILLTLILTDSITYGDSRHRLLIAPVLYIFQLKAFFTLRDKLLGVSRK